ncbi:MAG: hypothetical protein H6734_27600 [Alphaproteobacteria bacterium]|nr:hypothetical protein [Alphaproteobacteria bacterium]
MVAVLGLALGGATAMLGACDLNCPVPPDGWDPFDGVMFDAAIPEMDGGTAELTEDQRMILRFQVDRAPVEVVYVQP